MRSVIARARHVPADLRRRWRRLRSQGSDAAVLMYHRIAEPQCDPWQLAVSPGRFDEHLAMLKRERPVLDIDEFTTLLGAGQLPKGAVTITFDDGYACNALTAAPILHAYQLPAIFFLTAGAIGAEREFWWDELLHVTVDTHAPVRANLWIGGVPCELDLGLPLVPLQDLRTWTYESGTNHPRLLQYVKLWTLMRAVGHQEQREILDAMWARAGASCRMRPDFRPMTCEEARGLAQTPRLRVAPHTVTHPALSEWPEAIQRSEIEESRTACLRFTGNTAPVFAYPYGNYGTLTMEILRQSGFQLAFSTRAAAVSAECDMFAVPRLQVLNRPATWLRRAMRHLT